MLFNSYTLAGTVAIEALGGKRPYWRPGRRDVAPTERVSKIEKRTEIMFFLKLYFFQKPTPDGRLPDASQGADHLRSIFYRMGFTDQEMVRAA